MKQAGETMEQYAARLAPLRLRKIFANVEGRIDEFEAITGDANTAAGLRAYIGQAVERLDAEWDRRRGAADDAWGKIEIDVRAAAANDPSWDMAQDDA